jgi:disulfide bond formation protein DsbB
MLINFIGFSFLCGIGLGLIIVLVLVLLRKATEQRIKWAILASAFITTTIAIVVTMYVLLLPSPEKQIRAQLEMIPDPSHSSQLFEHAYIISSAAGNCATTMIDRWFGLEAGNSEQTLIEWYSGQLMDEGWQQVENTTWQKNDSNSIFTINIEVFMDTTRIDSQQWFYSISSEELKQASAYPAAYVLKSSVKLEDARARCLGQ